ncbi:hypothetical protein HX867_13240 [Pseudomonas gingeri]|uniref:hypothetical protein n=1 Tax=Pseudomonas gingeri TaxID=117681 RepID=UPI0015A0E3E8|nr:hypothetical protein [Pseudomonas gingeri]NVZ63049.1 hypothetical protein [Pseudomonas gingeri]NVZ77806.1 hypothetical protein [Pseudomonas gingeri]
MTINAAAAQIRRTVANLESQKSDAKEYGEKLQYVKYCLNSVSNQPESGTLRLSKTKGIHLSKSFNIREALGIRDAGVSEFEKTMKGLDLKFGKKTNMAAVNADIDKKISEQNAYLKQMDVYINNQKKKLADLPPPEKKPRTLFFNADGSPKAKERADVKERKNAALVDNTTPPASTPARSSLEFDDDIKPPEFEPQLPPGVNPVRPPNNTTASGPDRTQGETEVDTGKMSVKDIRAQFEKMSMETRNRPT